MTVNNKRIKLSFHMAPINDIPLVQQSMFTCFSSAKLLLYDVDVVYSTKTNNIVSRLSEYKDYIY